MIGMLGDLSRSNKNGNYFVMEASGQNMFYELAYPKQLRLQAFSHIASGANMIADIDELLCNISRNGLQYVTPEIL